MAARGGSTSARTSTSGSCSRSVGEEERDEEEELREEEYHLAPFMPALHRVLASGKRIDYLDAFDTFGAELQAIPLGPGDVDPIQARKDSGRDNIVLNGCQFVGAQTVHLTTAMSAVAMSAGISEVEAGAITERTLCGCSRSTSGADSYFILHRLFGTMPGLIIKPRCGEDMPVCIDMRSGGHGSVLISIESTNLWVPRSGLPFPHLLQPCSSDPPSRALMLLARRIGTASSARMISTTGSRQRREVR